MNLCSFKEAEATRITTMQAAAITDERAESLMLRACLAKGIIAQRMLPEVWREWREPGHEAFQPRTAWSLLNAFTTVLTERAVKNPQSFVGQSIRLNALLSPEVAHAA